MYCIDHTAAEPIMLINTHIGFDVEDGMGVDGAEFQRELLQLDSMGKKRIQVWINSPGGNVMDGYNIFSAICDSKTPVDTYAKGMVASIAGAIFMAGRKRYMTDYSSLMMHNPFGGDDKKQLGIMKDSIATMIHSKSQLPQSEVGYMMDKTTWIVYGIVSLAAFYLAVTFFFNKKKKGCCNKGCGTPHEKPSVGKEPDRKSVV